MSHLKDNWVKYLVGIIVLVITIMAYIAYLNYSSIEAVGPGIDSTTESNNKPSTEDINGWSWLAIAIISWYVVIPVAIYFVLFIVGIPIAYVLENNPHNATDTKSIFSKFGFFTVLGPGRAKMIVRGEDLITVLMNYPGYTFKGMRDEGIDQYDDPVEYWKIVREEKGKPKYKLIPFPKLKWYDALIATYRYPWWVWKKFIFLTTRRTFTGIWPIQTVFIYYMEMWDGKEGIEKSISDHVRVEPFDYGLLVKSAGTADNTPIRIEITFTGRVVNPYQTTFKTNSGNWSARINSFTPGFVDTYTRSQHLQTVYASSDSNIGLLIKSLGQDQDELKDELEKLRVDTEKETNEEDKKTKGIVYDMMKDNAKDPFFRTFGIMVEEAKTPDRSIVNKKMEEELLVAALAKVIKRADITRAEGQAKAIEKLIAAAKDHGELGKLIAQIERDKTVTAKLPDGSNVILTLGNNRSSNEETLDMLKTMVAKLDQLKSSN